MHFRGNDGTKFRQERQDALVTIARVVARRGARFAVLSSLLADGPTAASGGLAEGVDDAALPLSRGTLKKTAGGD